MGRAGRRSGKGCCNKEGGAPEMVESNPSPTIPTTNPCPYGLRSRSSQPAPPPPGYALRARKHELSKPAPRPASRRRRAPTLKSLQRGLLLHQTKEEFEAIVADVYEERKKLALEYYPKYLADLAGEPAQLAIEFYRKEKGLRLELTDMVGGRDCRVGVGLVTHMQFEATIYDPTPRPTTVYAQYHRSTFFKGFKKHVSRVFTSDSPLPEDPRFKLDPTTGWIDYLFDCPVCGMDGLESEEALERLKIIRPTKGDFERLKRLKIIGP